MNTHQAKATRRRRTGEEVRQLMSAFQASGLRASEFCRRHGLAPSTLRRNLKRQRLAQGKPETGVRFVAVKVKGTARPCAPGAAPAALEVILGSGRRLGVAPGFDGVTLERLVRVLEGL